MDLENEGRTERGREERGRVSSMRITFHLVENLFLDGNERERCPAGLISPSFRRVGLVGSAATKRISSTRPPSGFPFLGLSFRRAFRRFSTRSGFDDGGQNFRRKRGNDDSHDGKEGNVPRVYPSPPQKRPSRLVSSNIKF